MLIYNALHAKFQISTINRAYLESTVMITSVSKTQTKVKTIRSTSNVLNFENVDDLLKYMSTVAF